MALRSIAEVAAASLNRFSSSSRIGSSVSSANLPSLGIARADYTHENVMWASVSLQDLTLSGKVNAEEDASAVNISGAVDEAKPFFYHSQRDGSVCTPKGSKSSVARPKCWYKVTAAVAAACLFVFLVYFGYHWWRLHWKPEKLQYSVVLDCGSTSTRVQVYAWAYRDFSGLDRSPVVIHPTFQQHASVSFQGRKGGQRKEARAYHQMETEPGLHKLSSNESGVRAALEPLLQWAKTQIPLSDHKNTPLFLLATAGMRGLANGDAEWLLDRAWVILNRSPFMCSRSWVKVISGVEEAYYGWVSLNYKFGRLAQTPQQSTFGALDLGGSSLQVTFESEEVHHKEYGTNLSVGSAEHHLYAFSHAGFGLNDAFDKSVELLWSYMQENSADVAVRSQELQHPCLHAGFRGQYKCSHCTFQPSSATVPDAIIKKGSMDGVHSEFTLVGNPDWESCEVLANDIVNTSRFSLLAQDVDCIEPPCALGRHQPTPHGKFYALSGFFVVYKFFGLKPDAGFEELLDQGKAFCEKPWKIALESVVAQPLVEHYCFRAPYVVALLQHGLHLKQEQITVGSGDMTWTLGAALLEAGAFTPTMLRRVVIRNSGFQNSLGSLLTQDTGILLVFLLVIMVLVLFAVIYFHNCISFFGHNPQSPLFTQLSLGTLRLTSIFLTLIRLGFSKVDNSIRNGDGRCKTPNSPAPLGTLKDQAQSRFGSVAMAAGKCVSELSSRRTHSRDDLLEYWNS